MIIHPNLAQSAYDQYGADFERQSLQISAENEDPKKEFADGVTIDFFRHPDKQAGTLAAAMLYSESEGQLRGVERDPDGYFTIIGKQLAKLIQQYEASIVVAKAA